MSSIVSRRPPVSGMVNHSNERRWMSMRLGTSSGLFRRAKLRRVRGTVTAAKMRLLRGRETDGRGRESAVPGNLEERSCAPLEAANAHGPRSPQHRVCGAALNYVERLRLSVGGASV